MEKESDFGSVYKNYSGTVEFKKMSQRRMEWPNHRSRLEKNGKRYICRPMSNDEIESVCMLYWIGIPECKGTNFDFLHHPQDMREMVGDGDSFMKKDWFIYVVEDTATGGLCAGCAVRADRLNMTVWGEVGVVDPHYRQEGIFSDFMAYMDAVFPMTGAEYGLARVATFNTISQHIMERHGWNVCGIFRGGNIMNHGGDDYYRHPIILMEKFFNDGERVTARDMDLTSRSRYIWKAIKSQE
jgi:RimJ/RimL family protein N-acetyltransferase